MICNSKGKNRPRIKSGMTVGRSGLAVGGGRLHAGGRLLQMTKLSRANAAWPTYNTKSVSSHIEPGMPQKSLNSRRIRAHRAYGIDSDCNQTRLKGCEGAYIVLVRLYF